MAGLGGASRKEGLLLRTASSLRKALLPASPLPRPTASDAMPAPSRAAPSSPALQLFSPYPSCAPIPTPTSYSSSDSLLTPCLSHPLAPSPAPSSTPTPPPDLHPLFSTSRFPLPCRAFMSESEVATLPPRPNPGVSARAMSSSSGRGQGKGGGERGRQRDEGGYQYDPTPWQRERERENEEAQVTPWIRSVASGIDLLRNPKYNKGMAFTEEERDRLYLHGLLPAGFMDQDLQVERVLWGLRAQKSDLDKYVFLMALQERNERLFFRVIIEYIEEMLPIIYTPTVGLVCQHYGLMFKRPRGLFLSIRDRGRVMEVLKNWPERRVKAIVVTDGERVLGLGDLGVQGMAIAVAKLALYTACGGVHPAECLPVTIDVGTNNQQLLEDPFYVGLRQPRVGAEIYDELIDEFMDAVKARYGPGVLVQFEDFAGHNAFRLLFQYRGSHLVFNDDIQGTAAVTLGGVLAALPLIGGSLSSHTFLFVGAGEAGIGIAELLAAAISRETELPMEESRQRIWLMDSKGLVVRSRIDSLQAHKVLFAHEHEPTSSLAAAVKALKPSVLIGVSGKGGIISEEAVREMATYSKVPLILALSNPTSHSECTAKQAYTWTEGRALFASGSPFDPVTVNGRTHLTGQGNNAYVFPGIALGLIVAGATRLRDEMFLAAAEALAAQVTDEERDRGLIFPSLPRIRDVSAHVARAVAGKAYDMGLATNLPKPPDLLAHIHARMYTPFYRRFK